MIKSFIMNCGRNVIDISASLIFLCIVISGIIILFIQPVTAIIILIFGSIIFAGSLYFLYLFIDINDKLDKIIENQQKSK